MRIGNQWALVSKSDSTRVLKWFGTKKPTAPEVEKEERRIQFFKAVSQGKIPTYKIKNKKYASVKRHRRKDGTMVKAHLRNISRRKRKNVKPGKPNYT